MTALKLEDVTIRYGGTVAAPAFSRTMERCLRYFNIQPTEPLPQPRKK